MKFEADWREQFQRCKGLVTPLDSVLGQDYTTVRISRDYTQPIGCETQLREHIDWLNTAPHIWTGLTIALAGHYSRKPVWTLVEGDTGWGILTAAGLMDRVRAAFILPRLDNRPPGLRGYEFVFQPAENDLRHIGPELAMSAGTTTFVVDQDIDPNHALGLTRNEELVEILEPNGIASILHASSEATVMHLTWRQSDAFKLPF